MYSAYIVKDHRVDLNKHWRFETASSELTVTLNYGVVEVVEWKPIE